MLLEKGWDMTLVSGLTVALLSVTYLLIGMIVSYHTPLGKKYYPQSQDLLVFFWILPIMIAVIWGIIFFASLLIDCILMMDRPNNIGLSKLFN